MNKYWIRHKDKELLCKENKYSGFIFWSSLDDCKERAIKGNKFIMLFKLFIVLILSDNECYLEKVIR
jgi:hypothetical protein